MALPFLENLFLNNFFDLLFDTRRLINGSVNFKRLTSAEIVVDVLIFYSQHLLPFDSFSGIILYLFLLIFILPWSHVVVWEFVVEPLALLKERYSPRIDLFLHEVKRIYLRSKRCGICKLISYFLSKKFSMFV